MKTLFKVFLSIYLCSLIFSSCKREQELVPKDDLPGGIIEIIKRAGFSTDKLQQVKGGYVVEGDIFLSEQELAQQISSPVLRVAKSEQYRTRNLITVSASRTITISVSGLPPAYAPAADEAIARFNAQNLRLSFQRVVGGGEIDIQHADLGPGVQRRSRFPDGAGNPGSPILLDANNIGIAPDLSYLASIIAHEIGHAIGFRHTDYFNLSYSCGGAHINEGDLGVGAINIPGTPTVGDPDSWMLACSSGGNRPFNANDELALRTLYGRPPQLGIGGYDLMHPNDQVFAFDYNSSGKADHLVLYRPGSRLLTILKNTNGVFSTVYATVQGLAGYDLASPQDRIFAFDYNGSGKADHLVLYRPGSGVLFILKNSNGNFSSVFTTYQGLGGYNLASNEDKVFAIDYTSSGKLDHLVLYRPGSRVFFILQNNNGTFTRVFQTYEGLGGYDLASNSDLAFAYDYTGTGKADHLVLYRPGTGVFFILKHTNGWFTSVFSTYQGFGGYNIAANEDRALPFDYAGSGNQDHIILYRPGSGVFFVEKNTNGSFSPVINSFAGVAGYSLLSPNDKVVPFDYLSNGRASSLFLYRPGSGLAWILQNNNGVFTKVY